MKITDLISLLGGLGLFLYGMQMMSNGLEAAAGNRMKKILEKLTANRFLGVLVGAGITAAIQSSSASVGILQALAGSGVIGLSQAVYVLFGQNIGTCITAVLAAIGQASNAKRTTIIHMIFNIIGTTIFTIVCILTPFAAFVESLTPDNVAAQIANMHTIFNITTTILLLPFGTYLAKIATKILPDLPEEKSDVMHLEYIRPIPIENRGETKIGLSAIAVNAIKNELLRMVKMAKENVDASFEAVKDGKTTLLEEVRDREEYIDYLNKEISKYISKIMVKERNPKDSQYMSALFKVCGNLERIGDHAVNICEYTKMIEEKNITFSKEVIGEIAQMREICVKALSKVESIDNGINVAEIAGIEEKIDEMTEQFRKNQIDRMQVGKCSDEGCVLYSEMLTDFERIGDHILNVGQEMAGAVNE